MAYLHEVPLEQTLGSEDAVVSIVDGKVRRVKRDALFDNMTRYSLPVISGSEVDLSAGQIYKIDLSEADATLTIDNPPADRAMTVVIEVTGNTGIITWPEDIHWNQGTAPILGQEFTVVVLLWTGTKWIGSTGASF